jgi:hypothetical protein
MPIDTSGLTRAFKKLGDQFESKDPVYRAVIVSDDEENNWTVDFLNPDSSIGTRRSVKGNGYYWPGLQVRISRQRKIWGDDYWVIMGADMTVYLSEAPPETLALHGWTHGWDQPDETTNLSTFQVYSLRVQPADPADQTVDVLTGIYYAGGAFHYLDAIVNVNLAAYIAALGLGQRQYLVLSIDDTETINVTEGTPVVGVLDVSDIPDPPVDERALCAVDIRNGDTAIERERVYADLRWLAGGLIPATTYLRLDASNDPVTAGLEVNAATTDEPVLILQTTDDNATNPILEIQASGGGMLSEIEKDGNLNFATATAANPGMIEVNDTRSGGRQARR